MYSDTVREGSKFLDCQGVGGEAQVVAVAAKPGVDVDYGGVRDFLDLLSKISGASGAAADVEKERIRGSRKSYQPR